MAKKIDVNGLGHYHDKVSAMLASEYSSSKTYAVGDYCFHAGTLYECTTAITTAENWTSGHWTAAKLADDTSALKTAIAGIAEGGAEPYTPVTMDGWYYVNTVGRIDLHSTSGARTYLIDVSDQPESIHIIIGNTANRARFLYMTTYIDYVETATTGTYVDGGSQRDFTLTSEDYAGYNTIAVNPDYNRGTSGNYTTIEVTKTYTLTAVDKVARESIENITAGIKKGFGLNIKAATLTNDTLVLCSHIDNKKNASFEMWCNIDSNFTSVKMGHGYNVSYSGYVEVDSTTIKWYQSNGSLQKEESHGLTLSEFLYIKIEQGNNADGSVTIYTYDSTQTASYTLTGCTFHGSRGDVFCTVTGTVTNVSLSACFRDLSQKVWYFGDSYVSMYDQARWPYYALQADKLNFYLNGFGGANSSHALSSLNEAITVGTPDMIIWAIGMNNSDSSTAINGDYVTAVNQVIEICNEKNIQLVLCTIPNTPTRIHTFKNDFVRQSGYRYVDFALAVGANTAGSTWYDGMLEPSDTPANRVHPTILGAKALYYRLISDTPEMNK